jgi:hypothetical protein
MLLSRFGSEIGAAVLPHFEKTQLTPTKAPSVTKKDNLCFDVCEIFRIFNSRTA